MSRGWAWFITFLCVYFSIKVATTFLRKQPRMFTVMALSAFMWTMLLGYYEVGETSERWETLTGFLLIYIGGLLMLEAKHSAKDGIVLAQHIGVWLLPLIALPAALKSPHGDLFALSQRQTELLMGTVIGVAGFWVTALGVRRLCGEFAFRWIAAISIAYVAVGIAFVWVFWSDSAWKSAGNQMSGLFYFLFALLKLAYALAFGWIIAWYGMDDEDRNAGPVHCILRLIGLGGLK